jgi:hypothetical protein
MTETITTITTEDGAIIALNEFAYDYYGMGVVKLDSIDQHGQFWCCNCPVHDGPDHDTDVRDNYWGTWTPFGKFGGSHPWGGALDGSRVVSIAWATRKGWPGASDFAIDCYMAVQPIGWATHKLPR